MSLLRSIRLKKFRSHQDSTIKLSKNITVIVGKSLAGKSNIARALRWFVFNRPSGDKVYSNFDPEKETKVIIKTDTDTMSLKRKDKKNSYRIGAYLYSRVGTAVPDKIKKAINLDEINIQNQLDQHYLITSSPGQVTKEINKIIGADKADYWIKELTTKINYLNRKNKSSKEDKKRYNKELKKYKVIGSLQKINETIKDYSRKIEGLQRSNDAIEGMVAELENLQQKFTKFQEIPEVEKLLQKATLVKIKIQELEAENRELRHFKKIDDNLTKTEENYQTKKDQYLNTIKELGKCPLCASMINKRALERISRNL